MSASSRLKRALTPRVVSTAAIITAVTTVSLSVFVGSNAAFTDVERNTGNDWATGKVNINTDHPASAMFYMSDMNPGSYEARCITITSASSADSNLRMYAENLQESAFDGGTLDLAKNLRLKVTAGSGGVNTATPTGGDYCAGFVPGGSVIFEGVVADFYDGSPANAAAPLILPLDGSVQYKVETSLPSAVGNEVANEGLKADLVWVATSR